MRNVTAFEKDELLRFMLHHMTQEQRRLLMVTYPLHYAMLFPTVDKETLAFKVAAKIEDMAENSANIISKTGPFL